MSNYLVSTERSAKRQVQIAWLRAQGLLDRLPNAETPPDDAGRELLRATVKRMIAAGLYSPGTTAVSLRWGVRRLVSEARGEGVRFSTRYAS